jgi:hypothetical protein
LQINGLLKIIAALLVGGVTMGSTLITLTMAQLDRGLARNVQAAEALVDAQRAIKEGNQGLAHMVVTTNRIGDGMERLLSHSEQVHRHVQVMAQASRSTLEVNRALEQSNAATPVELRRMLASLRSMNGSASAIRDYLRDLRDTASLDVDRLEAISAITARMNTRTPGW